MPMPTTKKWLTAVSAAALFTLALPAQAQQPPEMSAPESTAQASIPEAKLQQFAAAFTEVVDLQQEFSRQLEGVESNEQARSMQQEVQQQMIQAVQNSGMTVEQYNDIANRLDQDPELRQRVMNLIDTAN